jgi:folate-binding protein YgfZ
MTETATGKSFSKAYAAVREGGIGIIDLTSRRGRISVSGKDAVMFLNGLVTNDLKSLAPNTCMSAIFPTVQGRVIAVVRIFNLGDHFLIDTESATYGIVLELLSRFTLAGDFRVTDVTEQTAMLSVQSKHAPELITSLFGEGAAPIQLLPWENGNLSVVDFDGSPLKIVCATHTAEKGFDLLVEPAKITDLRQTLLDAGGIVVDDDTLEILRIEAGVPRYGVDIDANTVVNETGLTEAISFTKGCYIGQEIIIRIKHRGHVAKKLTGIIFPEEPFDVEDPTVYSEDGQDAGRVTSWVISPNLGYTAAMAYIKFDYLKMLTPIEMQAGGRTIKGIVCNELPLVRGTWYDLIDNTPFPITSSSGN